MCQLEAELLRKARTVTDEGIAQRMNAYLQSTKVSADMVQKYFSGGSGVPLKYLGALLAAMGKKTIEHDDQVVSADKLHALTLLAKDALQQDLEGR